MLWPDDFAALLTFFVVDFLVCVRVNCFGGISVQLYFFLHVGMGLCAPCRWRMHLCLKTMPPCPYLIFVACLSVVLQFRFFLPPRLCLLLEKLAGWFSPNSFCYRGSFFKSTGRWSRMIVSGECCWRRLIVGVDGRRCGRCCPGCRGRCCAGVGVFLVGRELGCCWWCVKGMWLGGVAWDVVGGVLWRVFMGVMGFKHMQSKFPNSIRMREKYISSYLGSMVV